MKALVAFLLTALVSLGAPAAAAAAGDYTLPFHDPGVGLSYGVDRDRAVGSQLDWTGQAWKDTAYHWGRVYDQHSGIDYPMPLQSAVAAARDGTVLDIEEGFGTTQFGSYGNFVRVGHPDGVETLYYHLAFGGALVSIGAQVQAGQTIGRSGCSGICYGSHLHFQVSQATASGVRTVDPMAERWWTTWPGRVPFLGGYVRESNASTEVIRQYTTATHWVEFRNLGGRTWWRDRSGARALLATWLPATRSSQFRATDWRSASVPTWLDPTSVPPDGTGRFTFGLRAAVPTGSYSEAFNLRIDPIYWFDAASLGNFYIPITVITNQIE
jgi:murein DD-endopeptidase MepM/ murein hydrolase activator NlpD